MKKLIASLVVLLCVLGYSQDTAHNIFGKKSEPVRMALYFSLDFGYQQLLDDNLEDNQSIIVGARLGAVMNEWFMVGLYGFTNTENLYNDYIDSYLRYGGGGLLIEPRLFPNFPVHISLPIRAGFGTISYADNNWSYYDYEDNESQDKYFIFEPGAELELNIVKYFKISGGLSYRMTDAIDLIETPNDILNGWNYYLSLKIVYP